MSIGFEFGSFQTQELGLFALLRGETCFNACSVAIPSQLSPKLGLSVINPQLAGALRYCMRTTNWFGAQCNCRSTDWADRHPLAIVLIAPFSQRFPYHCRLLQGLQVISRADLARKPWNPAFSAHHVNESDIVCTYVVESACLADL